MKSKKPIYLDFAAASPMSDKVLEAMKPFSQELFYNPSALYAGARDAHMALEDARKSVAQSIGARPSEITFTSGGSESANLAIHGLMQSYPDGEIVISAVEHDAVRRPAGLYACKIAPVDAHGRLHIPFLEKLITDNTVLISVMYANNEVGTVQPIAEVVECVARIRAQRRQQKNRCPLYVHVDACQAPQYLDVNVARLGVDLMTLNGGKMYGPKQSGVLYHRISIELVPQIRGGGQEYGLRSGTENVAACVGFATALTQAVKSRAETVKQVSDIAQYFRSQLAVNFENVIFNGHSKLHVPHIVHVSFPGSDNERMLFSLDDQGVYAAAGSACSASSDEPSHVLAAMGVDEATIRASLRFSLGISTTRQDIDTAITALKIAISA